jgi:hypothetical protein
MKLYNEGIKEAVFKENPSESKFPIFKKNKKNERYLTRRTVRVEYEFVKFFHPNAEVSPRTRGEGTAKIPSRILRNPGMRVKERRGS